MAVVCTATDGLEVDIALGGHALRADEPAGLGGGDTGPSPFGLLLASVGACTTITIMDAARQRNLTVDRVKVAVSSKVSKVPSSASDPELSLTRIRRVIEIEGDLSHEDREWLRSRGEGCAVSRALEGGLPVDTSSPVATGG